MISLVNEMMDKEMAPAKASGGTHNNNNNNSQEAAELLGLSSSSDSLDSPSFSHFHAAPSKQKRKVRFKKPFRSSSSVRSSVDKRRRRPSGGGQWCRVVEGAKILSCFSVVAVVGALLWYVVTLGQRIQELQDKFADIEAGNRNTPEALHLQHSKLKLLESNVTMLYVEVRKNMADIDNITLEVKHLKEVTNDLKDSLAAAPALKELPKNVHALSESLVNFGSKMNALESNLKELKEQQGNLATTAQNLSGEMDALKLLVQELSNSSEYQSRSSVNTSLQTAVQETHKQVHVLEGKLMTAVQSIHQMNNTLSELPARVDTLNEAILWVTNDTHSTHSLLSTLENFIDTNLTLRLEQLEAEAGHSLKNVLPSNIEYINKTISETIVQLVNRDWLNGSSNDSFQQTHDVLVLLAALLQKFEHIPKSLSNRNATELVKRMLHEAFDEMMATRGIKMQEMDSEIKHPTASVHLNSDSQTEEDFTTPLFVQSAAPKGGTTVVIPPV